MISLFAFSSNCCKSKYLYIFFPIYVNVQAVLVLSTALLLKGNFQLDAFFSALIFLYSVSFAIALISEWWMEMFTISEVLKCVRFFPRCARRCDVMFSSNAMTVKELEANLKPQFINLQLPGRFGRGAVVKRSARKFGFLSWSGQCCKSYLRVH